MPRLLAHVKHIGQWNKRLQHILPGPIAANCQAINIADGVLVIQVNSSAWATKLRFFVPKLEKTIKASGLQTVSLKVATPATNKKAIEVSEPRQPLTAEASRTISQTAETINDKNLREALLRLAAQSSKTK